MLFFDVGPALDKNAKAVAACSGESFRHGSKIIRLNSSMSPMGMGSVNDQASFRRSVFTDAGGSDTVSVPPSSRTAASTSASLVWIRSGALAVLQS